MAAPLAELLDALLANRETRETVRAEITQSTGLVAATRALAGIKVECQSQVISFGSENQIGDVTIGTAVGGNLISIHLPTPELSLTEQRDRGAALARIHMTWVKTWLSNLRANGPRLSVRLTEVPELATLPMAEQVVELARITATQARVRGTLAQLLPAYDHYSSSLLVLGETGSGKTTLLVELLEGLIGRAQRDRTVPIPALLQLSSWAGQPLEKWAADELARNYQVPSSVSMRWIGERGLTLILDGLDEVPTERRRACLDALNDYLGRTTAGLVVSCRRAPYDDLSKGGSLACAGAVMVLKLDEAAVVSALGPLAYGVVTTLLETPLLVMVYKRLVEVEEPSLQVADSLAPTRLWPAYIEACFERRLRPPYGLPETERWLGWLARGLAQERQSLLLIEQIQPEWMLDDLAWQYDRRVGLGRGLLLGLTIGSIVGPILWLLAYLAALGSLGQPTAYSLVATTIAAIAALGTLYSAVAYRAAGKGRHERITLVDRVRWTVRAQRQAIPSAIVATLLGGGAFWLLGGPFIGLAAGVGVGGALGLLILLRGGEMVPPVNSFVPNQGVRRSGHVALSVSLAVGVTCAMFFSVFAGIFIAPAIGWVFGGLLGAGIGVVLGLFYGGETALKHGLLRIMLVRANLAPSNLAAFLEHCENRGLMRRAGGAYTFIHSSLQEYFVSRGR